MKIGIGLPNHIAGVPGPLIAEWARRAEQRGFESVTTVDRLVYPSIDSLIALALAAGASTNLALVTNILLGPLYPPAILAKQLASLADATANRLTIGIAVGGRQDDYSAAGVDFSARGRLLDDGTKLLQRAWRGEAVTEDTPLCPAPVHIPLLFGGMSEATVRRATTLGDGWVAGALRDYPGHSAFADRIRAGWHKVGRSGSPQLHASVNFAIGDHNVATAGRQHLGRYYGFKPQYADLNIADMLTAARDARDTVRIYGELGFDRLLFHPTIASIDQVDRLADAVL
jgi:alkanesulfonate monooxygenase SsuD/methylene tetrahydromethanopterin reductase-like flavin-dependent oxidoreductase (luciferase family)